MATTDTAVSVEQRLARLENVEAIKKLKSQYAKHCDNMYDPDGIVSLFVEDGIWEAQPFGTFRGRDEIHGFMSAVSKSIVWALHFMIDPDIELADDGMSAVGTWYMLGLVTMTAADDPSRHEPVVMTANYRDTYVKVDGRWMFKHLTAK